MARPNFRSLLLVVACTAIASFVLLASRTAVAQTSPTLAGTWSAGPLAERWNVGVWGTACGPKPVARDYPGGPVTIREEIRCSECPTVCRLVDVISH